MSDPPDVGRWLYEIKYDGYRTLAWLDRGEVRMASRSGLDWTERYRALASALARVRANTAVFDGEVAYVLEDGRTDFQRLQNALSTRSPAELARVVYFVFDLLYHDGVDLRAEPLFVRKERLAATLGGERAPLGTSQHVEATAETARVLFRESCRLGLEGLIGKRADRPWRPGRSTEWIKLKCQKRQELVIVGSTPQRGTTRGIGALLLGVHDARGELRYAGKVGTGFTQASLRELEERLAPLTIEAAPVALPARIPGATWVRPVLVAQVRFADWTNQGALRHPCFEGLRLDKSAREVGVEHPQPRRRRPGG